MNEPYIKPSDEFKNAIMGVIETAAFLKSGPRRFGRSFIALMQSFAILVVFVLPFNLYVLSLMHRDMSDISKIPYDELSGRYLTIVFYNLAFVIILLFIVATARGTVQNINRCICGFNWISVISATLMLFPIFLVSAEFHTMMDVQDLSLLIMIYELSLMTFLFVETINLRWFSAMLLATMICFIQLLGMMVIFVP